MKLKHYLTFLGLVILLIGGFGWISTSQASVLPGQLNFTQPSFFKLNFFRGKHSAVCSVPGKNAVRCNAQVMITDKGNPQTATLPNGYGPAQFTSAYNLSGQTSTKKIIAVVDAYGDPNVLSDLNNYSNTFGLPQISSCPVSNGTTTTPCFQKVNQSGGTSYPRTDAGWALETSLDVEAAHAVCQNCSLLLVEANSSSYSDLMAAVDRAVSLGANVISNSYGSSEFRGETNYDSHFNHPGVAITFSSGDSGYGAGYPAASPYVTAVGGTTLNLSGGSYFSETAWSGTGSGCSAYENQPSFQSNLHLSGCSKRMIADVAADADPNTGAAVYDSVPYLRMSGWFQVGGTSLSAALMAGVYALAGTSPNQANSIPYSLLNYSTNLHDVTQGSNARSCKPGYLCTAGSGYDGPTGLGTPNGSGAF